MKLEVPLLKPALNEVEEGENKSDESSEGEC
jgi:hypothetical protein